jgi:hypothetical protein
MSNIVFYSPQNLMTETHSRSIIKGIDSTMLMAGVEVQQPRVVDYRNVRNFIFPRVNKRIQGLRKQVWELVMGRVALEKEQHVEDIFGDLLGQAVGKEGHALSNGELMADALVMVIAGAMDFISRLAEFLEADYSRYRYFVCCDLWFLLLCRTISSRLRPIGKRDPINVFECGGNRPR